MSDSSCNCCDQCELEDRALAEPHRFSFVWVQCVIVVLLLILTAQFVVSMFKKRKDILKYHDTISSFCACKHGWENKFLLIFTLVVSANMLCLHFEEYNHRNWDLDAVSRQDLKLFVIFLFECLFIIALPFVGIFYTQGKHPDPRLHNKDYECPYGNCSIKTSQNLHRCGAYSFLLGLCCTSILWGALFLNLWRDSKYLALAIVSLSWAVLQFCGGIAFVVLQFFLEKNYCIQSAFQPGEIFRATTQLDLHLNGEDDDDDCGVQTQLTHAESNGNDTTALKPKLAEIPSDIDLSEDVDFFVRQQSEYEPYMDTAPIGEEQQQYRLIATKLRYVSFAIEGIVAASVILLVTFNTIVRMILL